MSDTLNAESSSLKSQKEAWEYEYGQGHGIGSTDRVDASPAIQQFVAYVERYRLDVGKRRTLDVGCGTGKNALYLAEHSYEVTGVDFSETALHKLLQMVRLTPYVKKIATLHSDITKPLPFKDDSFDVAVDITTTTSLSPSQLVAFESEIFRVIRSRGYFLTYVFNRNDGVLHALSPGGASVTAKESGISDYYFSEEELRRVYARWRIVEISEVTRTSQFYGGTYQRKLWWILLQK